MLYKIIKDTYIDGHKCVKQEVRAMIITKNGYRFFGSNKIGNEQKECPRDLQNFKSGEGYHLCKEICNQGAHAEVNAINNAIKELKNIVNENNVKDSIVYLIGHTYCCQDCLSYMTTKGIKEVFILAEDSSVIKKYILNKGVNMIRKSLIISGFQ